MNELLQRSITGFILLVLVGYTFFCLPAIYFSALLVAALGYILVVELPRLFNPREYAFWLIMPLYPVASFLAIISLNQSVVYRPLLVLLFIMVFCHDSGAYFVGKLMGKHKIAPAISPGKSWEGFIGGYLSSVAGTLLFLHNKPQLPWFFLVGFLLIVNALAMGGDFFESYLKRRVGLKDSGALLPGHGGLLDRVDSILPTVLLFYLMRNYLIQFV